MEWYNLHRSVVEGPEVQKASATAVKAWLFLSVYCAGQENGGRIERAKDWTDRMWLKAASLSIEEVQEPTELWFWDGDDLVVEFYPADQEAALKKKRRGAVAGGKKRGEQMQAKAKGKGQPMGQPMAEGKGERKGREGKEKEGNEREEPTPGDDSSVVIPTEAEVRDWASRGAGVDPDFAAQKYRATCETHGWVKNGRLLEWRDRFKRYWEEDKVEWLRKHKKNAPVNGVRLPTDQDWWWTEDLATVGRALEGSLIGGRIEMADRIRTILKARGVT